MLEVLRRPIAVWAGHAFDGQRVVHFLGRQHALTDKTEPVTRLAQISGKPDALIEDKARAAEMSATAVFEILQNTSFKLEHLVESILNQEWSRLLATNAAGAEGNDGVRLILLQKFRRGSGELAKVFNTDRYGALKRAQSNFKIVAYVEQRERPAFVEPLFELAGCQFGRWLARRGNSLYAKCDDLLLDFDEHPPEWLVATFTDLRRQFVKPRHAAQEKQKLLRFRRSTGHEQVDSLRA